jgi:hypothetical protein
MSRVSEATAVGSEQNTPSPVHVEGVDPIAQPGALLLPVAFAPAVACRSQDEPRPTSVSLLDLFLAPSRGTTVSSTGSGVRHRIR